jgi:hypothetical protein
MSSDLPTDRQQRKRKIFARQLHRHKRWLCFGQNMKRSKSLIAMEQFAPLPRLVPDNLEGQ